MELPEIDSLWDYQDPPGSEARFRELHARIQDAAPADYTAELKTQLARAVCLQRRFDDAHAILDEASQLVEGRANRAVMRCWLERSRVLNDTDRTEESLERAKAAAELAQRLDERQLAADALHMIVYVADGEASLRWGRIAIEFCERYPEDRRLRGWSANLRIHMADMYEELGQYGRGREAVEKAIGIWEDLGATERALGARCFLARLHRLGGEIEQALTIIHGVLETGYDKGWLFDEYGELLLATGRSSEAEKQFRRAYDRFSSDPWFLDAARLAHVKKLAGL